MPDYYVAIHNRGVALMAKGEFDRAIADFSHAIRLKPNYFARLALGLRPLVTSDWWIARSRTSM